MIISKPKKEEYGEYFDSYISLVKYDDPVNQLITNKRIMLDFFEKLPAVMWDFSYAEGKWSIKELMVHIIDTERIMTTRALKIARGEVQTLLSFDENAYVSQSRANLRTALSIMTEYKAVRDSSKALFEGICETKIDSLGHSNSSNFSPRALAFIIGGHEIHHMQVIRERYFPELFVEDN